MNVYELARRFSLRIQAALTPEQLATVNELNAAEERDGCCHSHDSIDANELMLAAWLELAPGTDLQEITHDERNAYRWGLAWGIAQDAGFDVAQITAQEREDTNYRDEKTAE
jgi:hypothetical protein